MDASFPLLESVVASAKGFDEKATDLIAQAAVLAEEAHRGQHRRSGEPYISHPAAVAVLARGIGLGPEAVTAAWLHDVVEDTEVTLAEVEDRFGDEVASLVEGLTKLDGLRLTGAGVDTAQLHHLLLRLGSDPRVVLVKICDRLHNLRTISALPQAKQVRIAGETRSVFAPLAHRMGLGAVRAELEDRCFAVLEPERHAAVAVAVAAGAEERDRAGARVMADIGRQLEAAGIEATFSRRNKHLWAIAEKSRRTGVPVDELHDLLGIRVVVADTVTCYQALHAVHRTGRHVPGTFKDYITTPKFNYYQSLHTVVVVDGGYRVEVQVRSEAMHAHAEHGAAAHWRYKTTGPLATVEEGAAPPVSAAGGGDVPGWAADLLDGLTGAGRDEVAGEIGTGEIYVFTPRGDLLRLPRGACAVDAAYAIHSEIGDTCTGAVVNGQPWPLTLPLNHGDRVEIRCEGRDSPDPVWLDAAVTGRARSRIRSSLRRCRDSTVEAGQRRFESWRQAGERWDVAEFAAALGYGSDVEFLLAVAERRVGDKEVRAAAGSPITRWATAATVRVEAEDRPGLLASVVAALAGAGADITGSHTVVVGTRAHQTFNLRVDDESMAQKAADAVAALEGTVTVSLGSGLQRPG